MSYTGIQSIHLVYRHGVDLYDVGSEGCMYQQTGKNCRNPKVPKSVDVPLARELGKPASSVIIYYG
jgi:hypothetical protein